MQATLRRATDATLRTGHVEQSSYPPVVRTLLESFGGAVDGRIANDPTTGLDTRRQRSTRRLRHNLATTDVVDEELCDDVIQFLAPTLESYRGCTLLDVHPGSCVWSRKLHDFLRPRHHILMEPDLGYVESFIKPLLQEPGSTYRHTTLSGAHPKAYFGNYTKLLTEGKLLPPRPALSPDDPKRLQVDTSFLVTGNLARRYNVRTDSKYAPFAQLSLQHMTWAALANELFHSGGRVRMLWWVPEMCRALTNAPSLVQRSAYQVGLRMGADINEVVVSTLDSYYNPAAPTGRENQRIRGQESLLAVDRRNVELRMERDNMRLPPGRAHHRRPESGQTRVDDARSPTAIIYESLSAFDTALSALESRWESVLNAIGQNGKVPWKSVKGQSTGEISHLLDTIAFPQCRNVVPGSRCFRPEYAANGLQRLSIYLDLQLRLVHLEVHHCHFAAQGADLHAAKQRLLHLARAIDAWLQKFGPFKQEVEYLRDEQHAFYASPQPLAFSRRAYEPLQAAPSDFWPHSGLALLDVAPTSREMRVPGIAKTKETIWTCQTLLKHLFSFKSTPLPDVLDRIAPNAGRDLIPMAPAITDARKGGRLNPYNVRPRILSEEMIDQLLEAWFEWPFRPPTWDLELMVSNDTLTTEETVDAETEVLAEL